MSSFRDDQSKLAGLLRPDSAASCNARPGMTFRFTWRSHQEGQRLLSILAIAGLASVDD
jgi:hypothetical protein